MLQPENRTEVLSNVCGRGGPKGGAAAVGEVRHKPWRQFDGDRDQMRRGLDMGFRQLTAWMMSGIGRMRLREIRQVARRERRRDGRHGEHEEAQRDKPGARRAVREADHGARWRNKNPASFDAGRPFRGAAAFSAQIRRFSRLCGPA